MFSYAWRSMPQQYVLALLVLTSLHSFVRCGVDEIDRQRVINRLLENYDNKVSPTYNSDEPVLDVVQLYVVSIDSISDSTMDYTMSFFLRQRWTDPRLAYNDSSISVLEMHFSAMSKIWVPDLYIYNEKSADFHHVSVPNKLLNIFPDGRISYSVRVTGTFSCDMIYYKYPLDKQICAIRMESYGHSTKSILIRWNSEPVQFNPELKLGQFVLDDTESFICDTVYMEYNYSCIGLNMHLSRMNGYYFIHVYVPSILIVLLSWVSFWVDVEATAARVSLGLLTVLTMTTQSRGIADVQRVSYITAMNVWMSTCLLFVFAALVEFAYVNVVTRVTLRRKITNQLSENKNNKDSCEKEKDNNNQSDELNGGVTNTYSIFMAWRRQRTDKQDMNEAAWYQEQARAVDRYSRILFPLVFIVFNIIYWCFYYIWEPVKTNRS